MAIPHSRPSLMSNVRMPAVDEPGQAGSHEVCSDTRDGERDLRVRLSAHNLDNREVPSIAGGSHIAERHARALDRDRGNDPLYPVRVVHGREVLVNEFQDVSKRGSYSKRCGSETCIVRKSACRGFSR